ncbi:FFLEELY motif protein, partial [Moraxella caviae]
DADLRALLRDVQAWQKSRIHRNHAALFTQPNTAPLAHYLIDRIYSDKDFDVLAEQLLTAGHNALAGSGRLEKLIPSRALATGVLGVQAAVNAIDLDLQLASHIKNDAALFADYQACGITDSLAISAYQAANDKSARLAQIHDICTVCAQCAKEFNSFLLFKAFGLAKSTAYKHGYQPLYDFIHEGFAAIQAIDKIDNFTKPFKQTELDTVENIYRSTLND